MTLLRTIWRYLRDECVNCGQRLTEIDRWPGAIRCRCPRCGNAYDIDD